MEVSRVESAGSKERELAELSRELLAPEPLSRSLWHGVKAGLWFSTFMWATSSWVDADKPHGLKRFLFNTAWFGSFELLRRRTGSQFSPAALRVSGITMAGMGAILTALGAMRSETPILGFGLGALLLGGGLTWFGFRKRGSESLQELTPVRVLPPEQRISAAELAARLERQAASVNPRERRNLIIFISGLGALLLFTFLPLPLPDAAYGVGLGAMFTGVIGTIWYGKRILDRDAERFGTKCPQCKAPFGAFSSPRQQRLLEIAGICPGCRTQVTEGSL